MPPQQSPQKNGADPKLSTPKKVAGVDIEVPSFGLSEFSTHRRGGERTHPLGSMQGNGSSERSYQEEENNDTLCTAFVKRNIARDKRETQQMVESLELLANRNYKVMESLSDIEKWTSTLFILDTGAGPNLRNQSFALTTCFLSIGQVKGVH